MAQFSSSDAALAGFSLIRRRPAAFAAWVALRLLAVALTATLFVSMVAPELSGLLDILRSGQGAPRVAGAETLNAGAHVFNQFSQVITFVVVAVLDCAVFRAILDPTDIGFASLRLGADEFRVGVVRFVFGLGFGVALAIGVLLALLSPLAMGTGHLDNSVFVPLIFLLVLLILAGLLLVGVRLSLAGAITFAEERLSFFDSWALTGRAFWPMLGAYLTAWLISLIIALAVIVGVGSFFAAWLVSTGQWPTEWTFEDLRPILIPLATAWLLIAGLSGALTRVIMVAPAAFIYRALTDHPA